MENTKASPAETEDMDFRSVTWGRGNWEGVEAVLEGGKSKLSRDAFFFLLYIVISCLLFVDFVVMFCTFSM